ncbi:hypothetical protein PRIPAC_92082, partial [Pristionchus pacificus]|uniref:Uncharacterized protein n=1 Tax=Pristionchus pacificus TaxID=54126 RepID=A0A2A6BBJ6_PRIPA
VGGRGSLACTQLLTNTNRLSPPPSLRPSLTVSCPLLGATVPLILLLESSDAASTLPRLFLSYQIYVIISNEVGESRPDLFAERFQRPIDVSTRLFHSDNLPPPIDFICLLSIIISAFVPLSNTSCRSSYLFYAI